MKKSVFEDTEEISRRFTVAVREALLDHKRAGNPVAIWRDGKVVILAPEEIPDFTDNRQPTTTTMRTTIKQIAERNGLSRPTVSRILLLESETRLHRRRRRDKRRHCSRMTQWSKNSLS